MNSNPSTRTSSLKAARRAVDEGLQSLRTARAVLARSETDVEAAVVALADAEEAQRTVQIVANGVQQQAQGRIAGVVSRCLSSVFDEPYEFRIVFEQKRGRTEARLVFVRNDVEVDPMTAAGGGVVDVAAFALRLSCILLSRPRVRRLMVLDEPFKFVSEEYRVRVRQLLESLAKELQFQFIMVTHIKELETGHVVNLSED